MGFIICKILLVANMGFVYFILSSMVFVGISGEIEIASSAGNKSIYVHWTLYDSGENHILRCQPEGDSKPKLSWYINENQALPNASDVKQFKEPDGSISLQFNRVTYDIMDAYGNVEIASYTCVATDASKTSPSPTNYTNFIVFVSTPRSAGSIVGMIILLIVVLLGALSVCWRFQLNDKALRF